MRIFLGGASLGLTVGLLAGWLLFSASPDPGRAPPAQDAAPTGGPASADDRRAPAETARPALQREPAPASAPAAAPRGLEEAREEIARLEEALADTRAEATRDRATVDAIREEARLAEEKERARIPFPDDLPERFAQEPLVRAVSEALAGLEGQITAVDCTEFPCIVYADLPGHGVPPPLEFKNLMGDPAMAAYAEDSRMHFAYDDTDEEGRHLARHTGFAFFPKEPGAEASPAELGERVHKRVREWRKAAEAQAHPEHE
ncbi:MAG: hypothetical protein P1V51_04770 [Deltaproteobacteria bacterium]|nr:hypothetical protein [Deltaproteobacteria bacterium]